MKGIILAGDSGDRLYPLTIGIPKQLLPVYDKPMIYYPIETLVQSGINDILIITTAEQQPLFQKALGDGSAFNATFAYAVQDEPRGVAQAISIGEEFIGKESVCLITGDMIIDGDNVIERIKKAIRAVKKSGNATIFVENKTYPDQYGQVIMNREWKVDDVDGTADAICKLIENSSLYAELCEKGPEVIKALEPSLISKMWNKTFENILGQ